MRRGACRAVVLGLCGLVPVVARAATTTYTGPWAGGTILPADTVVLANGASVTGNVAANGTLQFAQTGSLTIGTTLSGTGTLAMANSGTLTLSQVVAGTTSMLFDTNVRATQGELLVGADGGRDIALGIVKSSSMAITGGIVRNASAYVASIPPGYDVGYTGRIGMVTVSGGTWTTSGDLCLGATGTGTLSMTGGSVSAATVRLAPQPLKPGLVYSGYGFVTMTGGTLSASGDMLVGDWGAGSVTIGGSAVAIVGGMLSLTPASSIRVNAGGTLRIGTGGTSGAMTANLWNDGTLVFDRAGRYDHNRMLVGTGGLVKLGSGTVAITGSNRLTGPTAVGGGMLQLKRRTDLAGGDSAAWTAQSVAVSAGAALALNVGGTGEFTSADIGTLAALGTGNGGFLDGAVLALDTTNAPAGTFSCTESIADPNSGRNTLGMVKIGSGTLALSGSNAFTGPATVDAGTLLFTRRAALDGGASAASLAARITARPGSTLAFAVGGTDGFTADDVGAFAAAGTGTSGFMNGSAIGLDTTPAVGGTFSYAGSLGDPNAGANAVRLVKLGDGVLVLSGSNTYTGGTIVAAGGMVLANPHAVSSSGTMSIQSGTLMLAAENLQVGTLDGRVGATITTSEPGAHTFASMSAVSSTFAGTIIDGPGSLSFRKQGVGTLVLSGSAGYSGPTIVAEGAVRFATRASLYGGDASKWSAGNLCTAAGATLAVNVGGAGEFDAADVGVLLPLGTGSTGFAAGAALGLDTTNALGGLFVYAGPIPDAGEGFNSRGLVKLGSGTLALSGSNSYTGETRLVGGVVHVGSVAAVGSAGPITFAGGTLQYSASNATDYSSRFSGAAGQAYAVDTNGRDVVFATPLTSGGSSLTKSGTGTLTLSGSSSCTAGLTIRGGSLVLPSGGVIEAPDGPTLVASSGSDAAVLRVDGGSVHDRSASVGEAVGTRGAIVVTGGTWNTRGFVIGGTGAGSMSVSDSIVTADASTIGLSSVGTGTVALTRTTWTGALEVGRGGTGVMLVAESVLMSPWVRVPGTVLTPRTGNGVVTFTSGTWAATYFEVGNSGTGTFTLNGGAVSTLGDAAIGNFFGNGSGTLIVNGGSWTSGGKLLVGEFGKGTVTVGSGAVSAASVAIGESSTKGDGWLTVAGGTLATVGNLTVGASGTGRLAISGSGVVVVGGTLAKGSKGTIVLNPGGTLQIGSGGEGGSLATDITNNGTLVFNRSGSSSCAVAIGGAGGLMKRGDGVLSLTGSNGLSGAVTVQQGGLRLAHSAALAAAAITPLTGGTVTFAPRLQTTLGGLDPTAGGLVDVGNGLVTVASGLTEVSLMSALLAGRGDGSWGGTAGIVSSTARADLAAGMPRTVGWLDHGDGSKSFAYAAPGDTNLDWQVDLLDAANFLAAGRFDTGAASGWIDGDFTYDGVVDILDVADFFSTDLYDAGGYNGTGAAGVAAVPEPSAAVATVTALAIAAGAVVRRRAGRSRR